MMNQEQLRERCKNRYFDRITILTDDLAKESANLEKYYHVTMSAAASQTGTDQVYGVPAEHTEQCASCRIGDMELSVVQPVNGDSVYSHYLKRFPTSLACLWERILPKDYDAMAARLIGNGLKPGQQGDGYVIFDLMDELGILYAIHRGTGETGKAAGQDSDRKICQINLVCRDVEDTARFLAEKLEIGPYEIGYINNQTMKNLGILQDGEMLQPKFQYKLGMNLCGNLEIETYSDFEGDYCFSRFATARPEGGFNHLKEVVPIATGKWQEEIARYSAQGIAQCFRGTIGPCGCCFMNTFDKLGFYIELGDGVTMTKLPEGYNAYMVP